MKLIPSFSQRLISAGAVVLTFLTPCVLAQSTPLAPISKAEFYKLLDPKMAEVILLLDASREHRSSS